MQSTIKSQYPESSVPSDARFCDLIVIIYVYAKHRAENKQQNARVVIKYVRHTA